MKHSTIAVDQTKPVVSRVLLQKAIKLSVLWHNRVLLRCNILY